MKPSTLLRPQTAIKKINRKPNEINGLAGHPYASARSPTVTFDNENKSTPRMKGSASQPHHTCRRMESKRSAQAGVMTQPEASAIGARQGRDDRTPVAWWLDAQHQSAVRLGRRHTKSSQGREVTRPLKPLAQRRAALVVRNLRGNPRTLTESLHLNCGQLVLPIYPFTSHAVPTH